MKSNKFSQYETPALRRYGRIAHITLQSAYGPGDPPPPGTKTPGAPDGAGPIDLRTL